MDIERWKDTVAHVKKTFKVSDEGSEHFEDEGGADVDYIVFESPMGELRLEYVTKPIILDKKTNYSKRAGSDMAVEYIYSETEKSQHMTAYKWNEDTEEWDEMKSSMFDK